MQSSGLSISTKTLSWSSTFYPPRSSPGVEGRRACEMPVRRLNLHGITFTSATLSHCSTICAALRLSGPEGARSMSYLGCYSSIADL